MTDDRRVRGLPPALYGLLASGGGASSGFVTITLGFILAKQGFPVAAVATLVSLRVLTDTWRVVFGPVLDLSLNPRAWYLISATLNAASVLGLAVAPLQTPALPILMVLTLMGGAGANGCTVSYAAAVAITAPAHTRGRIAGWVNAGALAGVGLSGGLGLWLATRFGVLVAGTVVASWIAACALPILALRAPRPEAGRPLRTVLRDLGAEMSILARSRAGGLALLAVMAPLGLGAFIGLSASVAGDWKASADLVAAVTGVLAGLISIPGALLGGYLCDRVSQRSVLAWAGFACGIGEAAMAFGPHNPGGFVVFVLLNNLLLGVAWAAVSAVIYDALRDIGAGTVAALLGSLCNVPVVLVTMLIGSVQGRYGSTGMLLVEAGLGIASALGYGLLAWSWKPSRADGIGAAAVG